MRSGTSGTRSETGRCPGPQSPSVRPRIAISNGRRCSGSGSRRAAQRLDALLTRAGFTIAGGTALFRLARCADADRAFHHLAANGILTRPFASDATLLRVGLPADESHWERLAEALNRSAQTMSETPEDHARHNARMARVQKARARIQQTKTLERGLLIVHTGRGKGKSSAAFGMALRSLGWGMRVAIVQYVKGKWQTGEKHFFRDNPDLLTFEVMGEGFTWDTQDRARDIAAARAAWERSKALILDPEYEFVDAR